MEQEMARDIYNQDKLLGVLHMDFVTWTDSALRDDP